MGSIFIRGSNTFFGAVGVTVVPSGASDALPTIGGVVDDEDHAHWAVDANGWLRLPILGLWEKSKYEDEEYTAPGPTLAVRRVVYREWTVRVPKFIVTTETDQINIWKLRTILHKRFAYIRKSDDTDDATGPMQEWPASNGIVGVRLGSVSVDEGDNFKSYSFVATFRAPL